MPTVNWMWMGNVDALNLDPGSNISDSEAEAIIGHSAVGKDELAPVEVTGNSYGGGGGHFKASHQGTWGRPPSEFSYTSPTGEQVTDATIDTFLRADYEIQIPDGEGGYTSQAESGILIQTSNGDLFFRPSKQNVDEWDDVTVLMGISVTDVSLIPDRTNVATTDFNADIFELPIVCFARGSMIRCEKGDVAIEKLKVGDLVMTKDRGLRAIRWIGATRVSSRELTARPNLRPVRIRAGALGHGLPTADLVVSPQHRILVRSAIAQRMFGVSEVLVGAKQLLALDGVEIDESMEKVDYFHMLFDDHEVIFANGTETESLYTGPQALLSVGREALEEIYTLFPELRETDHSPVGARVIPTGRQARNMVTRHIKNRRAILSHVS